MVLHNDDLNHVTWEMRAMNGETAYRASRDLPDFPYAAYAELIGVRGIRVDDPEALGAAWQSALAADRPVVLEVITDPNDPPLAPHITLAQARAFGMSLLKGDVREEGLLKRTIGQIFPGIGERAGV